MRVLSLILVGASLLIASAVLVQQSGQGEEAAASSGPADEIVIRGSGNTLASVAGQPGAAGLLSYDPKTRTATSHATLVIEGELTLGRESDPATGETLQFDTKACGDMRLEVRAGGVLRLYHSSIQTVSQVLSGGACSRGYAFFVDGELVMQDSQVSYISGSTSQCLRGSAKAAIRRSKFVNCDGSALSCVEVDGARVTIEECDFRGSGNWGVVVEGSGGAPLEIRRSLLDAQVGGLLVTGRSASVRLVDCVFDPAKLIFNHDSGELQIAWTRKVQVVDPETRAPVAGAVVRAECGPAVAGPGVEAKTDDRGFAELVLVERSIRPGTRRAGGTSQQYQLVVQSPGGERRVERTGFTVRGKDADPLVLALADRKRG